MSDDKDKKDQGTTDGTGSGSGTGNPPESDKATTFSFAELMGTIDGRIETAVRNVLGKGGGTSTDTQTESAAPESVAQQVRNELAKLNSEDEAAKKEADRDVTIQQLQDTVTKLSEAAPTQQVSKLTQFVWGSRRKNVAS